MPPRPGRMANYGLQAFVEQSMSESDSECPPCGDAADPRPPHVGWLTPYLTVRDAHASRIFYEKAFGFEVREAVDDDGATLHVEMSYRGQLIVMFAPEGASARPPGRRVRPGPRRRNCSISMSTTSMRSMHGPSRRAARP